MYCAVSEIKRNNGKLDKNSYEKEWLQQNLFKIISLLLPPITLMYICVYVHVLILALQNLLRVILQLAYTMFTKNTTNSDSIHALVHLYVCTRPHTGVTKLFTSYSTTLWTQYVHKIVILDSNHAHIHFYVRTRPLTGATNLFTNHSTTCTYNVYKKYYYFWLNSRSHTFVCVNTPSYWCYKTFYELFYNFAIPYVYKKSLF